MMDENLLTSFCFNNMVVVGVALGNLSISLLKVKTTVFFLARWGNRVTFRI